MNISFRPFLTAALLAALLGLGMWGYSLCCALIMEYQRQNLSWGSLELRACLAFLQLVLVLGVILWAGGRNRWLSLLLVLSAAGLLLPFSLLDEGGPRCVFLSALALTAAAIPLLEEVRAALAAGSLGEMGKGASL